VFSCGHKLFSREKKFAELKKEGAKPSGFHCRFGQVFLQNQFNAVQKLFAEKQQKQHC
jgi:hypothetical protein